MRNPVKILAGLAAVGIALAAGSAFTGAGVTSNAGATQFIGGTVGQSVTGATLSNIAYHFTDSTNTAMDEVTLAFADPTGGKTPTVSLNSGSGISFTCTPIDAGSASSCTPSTPGQSQTGLESIAVTVS